MRLLASSRPTSRRSRFNSALSASSSARGMLTISDASVLTLSCLTMAIRSRLSLAGVSRRPSPSASNGSSPRRPVHMTTPVKPPSRTRDEHRIRSAASPSPCVWDGRWRTSSSAALTSRRQRTPRTHPARRRSGPRPRGLDHRRYGDTARSQPATWWRAIGRMNSPRCCKSWRDAGAHRSALCCQHCCQDG